MCLMGKTGLYRRQGGDLSQEKQRAEPPLVPSALEAQSFSCSLVVGAVFLAEIKNDKELKPWSLLYCGSHTCKVCIAFHAQKS